MDTVLKMAPLWVHSRGADRAGTRLCGNFLWLTDNVLESLVPWGQLQPGFVSPALGHCCGLWTRVALCHVDHFICLPLWAPLWSPFVWIHPTQATLHSTVTAQHRASPEEVAAVSFISLHAWSGVGTSDQKPAHVRERTKIVLYFGYQTWSKLFNLKHFKKNEKNPTSFSSFYAALGNNVS